ncbi:MULTISPECIES: lanthionine synthetase C family protein [unclassified Arsukibacterium]|uniref:lanthionine synthetase C family protein n=1 Tax=unclassified Arsukibacterium TaxID=2635278 RepID=UPI0025C72C68|nr:MULTISPECIES: lanthionine synthetase C family protein [unclassified Arsukibacterium]
MKYESEIQSVIQRLIDATQSTDASITKNLSLLTGTPGHLLFHWYAAKSSLYQLETSQFQLQLDQLIDSIPLMGNNINFGYGLAGYGWLMELLLTEQNEGYDPEINQEIEEYITSVLKQTPVWHGEIEFVLGLSGIAVFAERRLRHERGVELYRIIINRLSECAIYKSADTCTWSTPATSIYRFDKANPDKPEHNLGLAHGVPAIICALLPAVAHPDSGQKAKKLVSDGCNWLIQQQLPAGKTGSLFSNCAEENQPSRLGWCYGDLTIALTLARAGKALGRQDLIDFACNLGVHAAQRREDSAMVHDAGICHGSSGLMLIFQLLNDIIPKPEFKVASDYWLENTLARIKKDNKKGFYANKAGQLVEDRGLLEGYSGIGLCLLARQGIAPDWADALLLA